MTPVHGSLVVVGTGIKLIAHCTFEAQRVIADAEVSRRHAMIFRHGADWWLSDLGSRNGVRVNGMRLAHARRLRAGDELRVAAHKLAFHSTTELARRTTAFSGETTRAAADAQGSTAPGVLVCELIVATAAGEIMEGDKAARWFFGKTLERPPGAAHALLPQAVRAWLARQSPNGATAAAALELHEADRRVVVTLCRCAGERFFLLVREENAQVAAEQLQALGLTAREAEVLRWVGEGKTNPEIAQLLGVTIHTVNRHLEHILAKLGVTNRQQAIVAARERLGA